MILASNGDILQYIHEPLKDTMRSGFFPTLLKICAREGGTFNL